MDTLEKAIDYNAYPNVGRLIGQLLLTFYRDNLPLALRDLPETKSLLEQGNFSIIMKSVNRTTKLEIKIADMGCGEGRSTQSLASIFPKAQVHGFDI